MQKAIKFLWQVDSFFIRSGQWCCINFKEVCDPLFFFQKNSLDTSPILPLPPAQNTIVKYMQSTRDKAIITSCYTVTASVLITMNCFSESRDPFCPWISDPMLYSLAWHYKRVRLPKRDLKRCTTHASYWAAVQALASSANWTTILPPPASTL